MIEAWEKIQIFLCLKSKFIMTIFTLNILGMCWYSLVVNKPLDTQVAIIYLAAIGFYSNAKTKIKIKGMEVEYNGSLPNNSQSGSRTTKRTL